MTPQHESQQADGRPRCDLIFAALAEKKEEERTGEKDRAAPRTRLDERKGVYLIESLEQHVVGIVMNGVGRK